MSGNIKSLLSSHNPIAYSMEPHMRSEVAHLNDNGPDGENSSNGSGSDVEVHQRASWNGRLEFVLTCVGYAVGLGNVWRFPYLCYRNGGGAFLIPYFIMLAVVGVPLFYLELGLGQFASHGPISMWTMNPIWKGLGYGMIMVDWFISLYYNVIIAHVLFYLGASMTTTLPWSNCDGEWTTDACVDDINYNSSLKNEAAVRYSSESAAGQQNFTQTASEEFYRYYVLNQGDGINDMAPVSWKLAICLLSAWTIVFLVLIRGVQSLGKAVYFTAIFPYVMLTVLLLRGLTLDGAVDGILYYLTPDFSRLYDPKVWADAATQIFFSLSACTGGLIAMSSFNDFNQRINRDTIIIPLINCGTSFYAGFVIFSVLGFMANEKQVPVTEVVSKGPGLAFVVYPEAISRMPVSPLWAVCFFIMMATLGFGSQFSIVETLMASFSDEFPWLRRTKTRDILFRGLVIASTFALGLCMTTPGGIFMLDLIDQSVSGLPLLCIGMFECIVVCWIYGYQRFAKDIEMMVGTRPGWYWRICWCFVSPFIIFTIVVLTIRDYKPPSFQISEDNIYHYPPWALKLSYFVALSPILVIPIWMIYYYCKHGGCWAKFTAMNKPLPEWGPRDIKNRTGHYATATTVDVESPSPAISADNSAMLIGAQDDQASRMSYIQVPDVTDHRKRQDTEVTEF